MMLVRFSVLLLLALAMPLAFADHVMQETYVGSTLGPASWAAACLEEVNLGAVCFPLGGHERSAWVWTRDELAGPVGSRYAALDADLLPLALGDSCYQGFPIPQGASFLVITLVPLLHVIPECQPIPTMGTVTVHFG